MEKYITGTGQSLLVHAEKDCSGAHCVIHNPSNHCMLEFPTHWRDDVQIIERICPHGIGHPDPDGLEHLRSVGHQYAEAASVHGCDGCCCKKVLDKG